MDLSFSNFFGLKYIFSAIGGLLLMIGTAIEPSIGIWVVSLGGSLLTVALGEDRNAFQIAIHVIIGLFWGIFGSQVIHAWQPLVPQIAASFFLSMFGLHASFYMFRNFKSSTFSDVVVAILNRIVPWKAKKPDVYK